MKLRLETIAAIVVAWAILCSPARALVVEDLTGTTDAPADDPGWNNITVSGTWEFIYLGDAWVLSARHVGYPTGGQHLDFATGSFAPIPGQNFIVHNPAGMGLTTETDLRLLRIKGDPPGVPSICSGTVGCTIATQPPPLGGEVVIVGHGRSRQASQTNWNLSWQEVPPNPGPVTYNGYKTIADDTKRWGTNQLANAYTYSSAFSKILSSTTGVLPLTTPDQITRDIASLVTTFDASGLPNEAQAVSNDSGSSVFYKRNGEWELVGIINANLIYTNQPSATAVYGDATTFADLSFYRNEILNIINANMDYSVPGDVNLDGIASGNGTGSSATDDVTAMVAGWMTYTQPTGDIASWKKGDLNHDGVTNAADFLLLSIPGDVNLDRVVSGNGTGPATTDDVSAFIDGWLYDNGMGQGDIPSWKKGDLNLDGKTDFTDFLLLRNALNPVGAGANLPPFATLLQGAGVPEPSSILLAMLGAALLAAQCFRRPRFARAIDFVR